MNTDQAFCIQPSVDHIPCECNRDQGSLIETYFHESHSQTSLDAQGRLLLHPGSFVPGVSLVVLVPLVVVTF